MDESKRETNRDKKAAYRKPEMKVMRINRFFFGVCQIVWPTCYSQYLTLPGAARCR
jgi:hypothetical protein